MNITNNTMGRTEIQTKESIMENADTISENNNPIHQKDNNENEPTKINSRIDTDQNSNFYLKQVDIVNGDATIHVESQNINVTDNKLGMWRTFKYLILSHGGVVKNI